MAILRRSASRSRIILSSKPDVSQSSSRLVAAPSSILPDPFTPQLDTNLPAGVAATHLYNKPERLFFARLLSSMAINQVYCLEDTEAQESTHLLFVLCTM